jgi:hypothetical protein
MNDRNPNPDGVKPDKSAGRRKRAVSTIDVEAREIPPAAAAEAAAPESPPPQDEAKPQAAVSAAADAPAAATKPKSALGGAGPSASSASESSSTPPPDEPKAAPPPVALKTLIIGGIAGGVAAALVIAVGWSAGLFSGNEAATPDPRIAALEAQLKELQNRPAAVSSNAGATDALAARIAKIEGDVAKLPSSPADDNAMKSLGVALAALNRRYDELATTIRDAQTRADAAEKAAADLRRNVQDVSKTAQAGASSAELASLQQRLAALEDRSRAARAEIAKATESDKAARLALSATAVRDAVLRGTPFAEELAQAKALGADEKALAPLWPLAASGVPSAKTLAKQLTDLVPQMKKAGGSPAASGTFLERLQANAEHLVRVRPAGTPAGDDAAAALARIEQSAAQDNIAAALADIGKLPEPARQVAANWVTRATARQKALDAARDFAADSARALGSK